MKNANTEVNYSEQTSPNKAWAFTYKKLGGDPKDITLDDYADPIQKLADSGFVKDIQNELDPSGRLHIHGIVMLRKGFLRKRLSLQGYHLKLTEIHDEKGWLSYINKDQTFDNKKYAF